MQSSLLTLTYKVGRKEIWLIERCSNCGGNLYLYRENRISEEVKKCLQCQREFSP